MLSYRHAFHAGNHADVLKHLIELQLLQYLNQKDKPYWYVDTHAGAGAYALDSGYAAKNAEYETGIARLWDRQDLPAPLADYVQLIRRMNPDGMLRHYPGSPWIAAQATRADDRLRLFELHSSDAPLLEQNMADAGRRAKVDAADGFAGLKGLLPPPPRRALVLIDPPYEDKKDYARVVSVLDDALRRFATGVYAVWYPQLQRADVARMIEQLKTLPAKGWLHARLTVQAPSPDGFGMHGSGMFVLNPPWTLHATLKDVMPYLVKVLGQDAGASYQLDHRSE